MDFRAERKRLKLTLRQVAEQAGCTPGHISMIENGVREPSQALAEKLETTLQTWKHNMAKAKNDRDTVRTKHMVTLGSEGAGTLPKLTFVIEGSTGRFTMRCYDCNVNIEAEFDLSQGDRTPVADFFTACLDAMKVEGVG